MKTTTKESLHALLRQIIDYAGLFPPAELSMKQTVQNYASFLGGQQAWMLGRLIVPVSRLEEFESCASKLLPREEGEEPWSLSGLLSPAGSEELEVELKAAVRFNRRHADADAGLARIDTVELKGNSARSIDAALDLMPDELYPYFELPVASDPRGLITTLVGSDAGAKIRTGGVTPELYPKPEHVARFIHHCAAVDVPFKATAGLHHPLRHYSRAVGADEFGFLNVFIAGCLAHEESLEVHEIVDILTEQDIAAFTIDPTSIAWRDCSIDVEAITEAREQFAVSFGSCSFDEPREDLAKLGLL